MTFVKVSYTLDTKTGEMSMEAPTPAIKVFPIDPAGRSWVAQAVTTDGHAVESVEFEYRAEDIALGLARRADQAIFDALA
jgi:hypothetical protein